MVFYSGLLAVLTTLAACRRSDDPVEPGVRPPPMVIRPLRLPPAPDAGAPALAGHAGR